MLHVDTNLLQQNSLASIDIYLRNSENIIFSPAILAFHKIIGTLIILENI